MYIQVNAEINTHLLLEVLSFFRYTSLTKIRNLLPSVSVLPVILKTIVPAGNNYKINYN